MNARGSWRNIGGWLLLIFLFGNTARAALRSDELLLIVNKNEPAGRRLAEFYAQQRQVPQDRIVELDAPVGEDIAFLDYETKVFAPVRDFLRNNKLRDKVRCLVTFYGVPLRVGDRTLSNEERAEVIALRDDSAATIKKIRARVDETEKLAAGVSPGFTRISNEDGIDALRRRADHAFRVTAAAIANDPVRSAGARADLLRLMDEILGRVQVMHDSLRVASIPQDTRDSYRKELEQIEGESIALQDKRYDRESRQKLRDLAVKHHGLMIYYRVLSTHLDYLATDDSAAAVDSELSMLWNNYSRKEAQPNYLNFRLRNSAAVPIMLMVSRIDAPTEKLAHDLIETSVTVESQGLAGQMVIDAGGAKKLDPKRTNRGYWSFEDSLTRLAQTLHDKTMLTVTSDDNPEMLPAGSCKDVALYVGWHSLRNYVASCKFSPGAVAYHTASYEMISLHTPGETGWAAGLLRDGAAVTIESVREPYLQAFPPPEDFFPLLLCGKLTLAEVYWRTTAYSSWQMVLIGDPLYTPYKLHPAMDAQDLAEPLKSALSVLNR